MDYVDITFINVINIKYITLKNNGYLYLFYRKMDFNSLVHLHDKPQITWNLLIKYFKYRSYYKIFVSKNVDNNNITLVFNNK